MARTIASTTSGSPGESHETVSLSWIVALLLAWAPQPTDPAPSASLAVGPPPRVPYAFAEHPTFGGGDWELVATGVGRHPFTENPALFAAYDDVVVNGYGTEGGFVVELFDGEAHRRREQHGLCSYALVTTPERGEVAWLQNDGSLVEQFADGSLGTRPVRIPGGACADLVPVALDGPTLYVDGHRSAPLSIRGPGPARPVRGLRDLSDVSNRGELVGRLPGGSRCAGLLGRGGRLRWRSCNDRLVSFSPDGQWVLGTRGRPDAGRFRGVVVHDVRSGAVAAEWDAPPPCRVSQVEWEDAAHLLVVVHERAVGWSVIRLGVDGSVEHAVAPVRTGAGYAPFRLPLS